RKDAGGKGRASCVDKANVFRAFAWFRDIFDARARAFPDLTADHIYIDACALMLVTRPWELDVLITENMFGDILSDLGAGLIGGMGYAPSADIGDEHAVFQPCHGSAPDIAGKGLANPTAMILSAAMMLEWLGRENGIDEAGQAGALIRRAVDAAFAGGGLRTCELGGDAGTAAVFAAVEHAIGRAEA
ncbi:MAG: isocitrate/isopropylmalate family dehydrogenase, partial [Chromatiales bacterium]